MIGEGVRFLKPGKRMKVFFADESGARNSFASRIIEIRSGQMKVEGPMEEVDTSILKAGKAISIGFMQEYSHEKGLPMIDTEILSLAEGFPSMITLSLAASNFRFEQRRKKFRYDVVMRVRYKKEGGIEKARWSVDISEGGMSLSGFDPGEVKEGDRLNLTVFIPSDERPLSVICEVVRINPGMDVGVKFANMSGESRLRLARFALELEQLMRKT